MAYHIAPNAVQHQCSNDIIVAFARGPDGNICWLSRVKLIHCNDWRNCDCPESKVKDIAERLEPSKSVSSHWCE